MRSRFSASSFSCLTLAGFLSEKRGEIWLEKNKTKQNKIKQKYFAPFLYALVLDGLTGK